MKYFIVQLCDSSVSFCHYMSKRTSKLIQIDNLKAGLLWAVKQGLCIHVLYPDYELSKSYNDVLSNYPHIKISPERFIDADVTVLNEWDQIHNSDKEFKVPVVLQTSYGDFIRNVSNLIKNLRRFTRLNIIFTDVHTFTDEDVEGYEDALQRLSDTTLSLYKSGSNIQLNLITDRLMLSKMNNCNAGIDHITLAPDGKFYTCPAFYHENADNIGNPADGLNIKNRHLYQLAYAPICRICDAYHCKRCVWLNKEMTLEVNTPSHQQCVMAHIERKIAKQLLDRIREFGVYAPDTQIPELKYNDPFEKLIKKKYE